MKDQAKIVHRFLIFRQAAQGFVHIEPEQFAFLVEIGSAPPVRPVVGCVVEKGRGIGGVLKRPPVASRTIFIGGHELTELLHRLFLRQQAASRGENKAAEIFRQSLIDPEQIVFHRHLIIRSRESFGAAIFSIPGMRVFVRKETRECEEPRFVDQAALRGAIVA